ncbi:zinc-binding dehydrogenase [Candidatus Leptofilum sp.]|uniref:zinc-binding dehydrogenase n=1 Tax=Candidatus Leptofilum sp. TaxID=3241576 RepID=UPI003B5CD992
MHNIGLEFVEKGKLAFRELGDPPDLGPTDILFETVYSGITNGTERHAFLAEYNYGGAVFPSQHGYQQVGKVLAVGEAVTQFEPGDWVFCGNYVGHNGWSIAPENSLLLKLPPDMDHKYCALFGVTAVALRSVRRMGVRAGDNVWVAGQGPIGHFVAQSARAVGARVTVTDMLDARLEAAQKCGAHLALNAADKQTYPRLQENGPYNFIYDCCSAKNLLFDIFEHKLLAYRGTVGLMAVRDTVTYPWSLLHTIESRIEVACHFDRDDLRVLLFLYQQGLIQIEPMVSHVASIEKATEIYDMLAYRGDEMLGTIFDWAKKA